MIRIIGIGSPFGDDAIGLKAAQILAQAPPAGCEVIAADRPGVALIEMMEGADAAILIDAMRSGAAPGTIRELSPANLGEDHTHLVTTHDIDVVTALQLARCMGRAPSQIFIIAAEIEADETRRMEGLSDSGRMAVASLIERTRALAARLADRRRLRLVLKGTVQGVGMRPFIWRLARSMGLVGFVRNIATGVETEVEGEDSRLQEFQYRLGREAPAVASIEASETSEIETTKDADFRIFESESGHPMTRLPPDVATCAECAREVFEPDDRRYRYPFTACASCGPRFTMITGLPYDRARTTLSDFPLCETCREEYENPLDRRFHAETTACPRCGPSAWVEIFDGRSVQAIAVEDAIKHVARRLQNGEVVAIRGLGGFHLACDATDQAAVTRLREIKRRPHKPLAVMVDSLETAMRIAELSADEKKMLNSTIAPIVLVRKRDGAELAEGIAPGNDQIGVMIAYSPLHRLLLRDVERPLVMTSANRPAEPIARDRDELVAIFDGKTVALLHHNRPIYQRCDDGVWIAGPRGPQPVRLSRGSAPVAISLPLRAPVPILATGGDIKCNFCLLSERHAFISQYIGNLQSFVTEDHFFESFEKLCSLAAIRPEVVVHDAHPDCFGRQVAQRLGLKAIGVQHHHAHIASCLAEHGHVGEAIGIAFDGAGYGTDGAIWGGEAFVADFHQFRRLLHLEYLPLVGGDAAVRSPARQAAAFLVHLFGEQFDRRVRELIGNEHANIIARLVKRGTHVFETSSCGRVFDAVAALVGLCRETTYEAQAAIELESLARASYEIDREYPFAIHQGVVWLGEMFAAVIDDLQNGLPQHAIARAFHNTVARIVLRMACTAREKSTVNTVALSGGCFQNKLLLARSLELLEGEGFNVLINQRVPANDGGLALGQAAVAAMRLSDSYGEKPCVSEFQAG